MRSPLLRLLAVPVLAVGLATACTDDEAADEAIDPSADQATEGTAEETEPRGIDQTMVEEEEFFDDPEPLIGSQVTFTGDEGDAVGANAFMLAIGDNELLVPTPTPPEDVQAGSALEVTGTVERLDRAVVEDQGITWDDDLEPFDGQVVLVAEEVQAVTEVPDEDPASDAQS